MGVPTRAVTGYWRVGSPVGRFAAMVGAGLAAGCASLGLERTECAEEAAWASEIESAAVAGSRITESEYEWTEGVIARSGSDAIGCLISLLDSQNREVRDLSAYVLSQIDGLDREHVKPVLKAALKPEAGGALPWVLARIDSEDAAEGMVELLRADPVEFGVTAGVFYQALSSGDRLDRNLHGWSAYAGIAARLAEALGRVLESREVEDEAVQRVALAILAWAERKAEIPVASVIRLATDPTRSKAVRLQAIGVLGRMGTSAAEAVAPLRKIEASTSMDLSAAASMALLYVEGQQSEKSYERTLSTLDHLLRRETLENRVWDGGWSWGALATITKLAQRGGTGRPAPVELLRLLSDSVAADARVEAAWTLGYLGDSAAGAALMDVLDDPDWLLAAAAADSLSRLRYQPAIESLESMATTHWYPPIRTVARRAVEVLRGGSSNSPLHRRERPSSTPWVFYADDDLPGPLPKPCVVFDPDAEVPRRDGFFNRRTGRAQAALHPYTLDGVFFDFGPQHARSDVVPDFGVQVEGGWLLASRRGEFGGELVFEPEGAPVQVVARGNFEDVHKMIDGRRVATEGLAHMGSDHGDLFELLEHGGSWSVRWWRRLPGSPQSSWTRRDGTLLVNTSRGSVVVHADGRMELAECSVERRGSPSSGRD